MAGVTGTKPPFAKKTVFATPRSEECFNWPFGSEGLKALEKCSFESFLSACRPLPMPGGFVKHAKSGSPKLMTVIDFQLTMSL